MPENAPVPLNRTERVLAGMIVGVVALSVVAIVATMVGANTGAEMASGVWPPVMAVGYFGLPLAFVLIVTFMVVTVIRRRRLGRNGGR